MSNLFNAAGFFVLFREYLEASLIIALLLQYVERLNEGASKKSSLRRKIWGGAISGLAVSLFLGIVFTIAYYVAGNELFNDNTEPLWEGIMMLIAVVLLTFVAFKMLRTQNLMHNLTEKIKTLDSSKIEYSLAALSFSMVVREGVESVVLVTGGAVF